MKKINIIQFNISNIKYNILYKYFEISNIFKYCIKYKIHNIT